MGWTGKGKTSLGTRSRINGHQKRRSSCLLPPQVRAGQMVGPRGGWQAFCSEQRLTSGLTQAGSKDYVGRVNWRGRQLPRNTEASCPHLPLASASHRHLDVGLPETSSWEGKVRHYDHVSMNQGLPRVGLSWKSSWIDSLIKTHSRCRGGCRMKKDLLLNIIEERWCWAHMGVLTSKLHMCLSMCHACAPNRPIQLCPLQLALSKGALNHIYFKKYIFYTHWLLLLSTNKAQPTLSTN